jgi:hypothetical protein
MSCTRCNGTSVHDQSAGRVDERGRYCPCSDTLTYDMKTTNHEGGSHALSSLSSCDGEYQ